MTNESWDDLYTEGTDWGNNIQQSFPLVKLSRKRAEDKPWIIKGLAISSKEKQPLSRFSSRSYLSRSSCQNKI